jgi:hypothetical protein
MKWDFHTSFPTVLPRTSRAHYKDITDYIGTRYYEAFSGNTGRFVRLYRLCQ